MSDLISRRTITPDQFRDKMYEIVEEERGYPETMHIAMDELMCETLKSLGYESGVKIFEKQTKWYS